MCLLWLALLAIGMCLQPVLAGTCELGDALGDATEIAVDAADHASGAQDDCCPSQSCSDCCAHVTASLERLASVSPAPPQGAYATRYPRSYILLDHPVDIRPPING